MTDEPTAKTGKDVFAFLKKDADPPVTIKEFQEMWTACSDEEKAVLIAGLPA